MEDMKSDAFQGWLKTQSSYAADALARLPGRAALRARLGELADGRAPATTRSRASFFYMKRRPGKNQPVLWLRQGLGGTERALLDPTPSPAGPASTPSTGCPSRLAASWWRWACPRAAAEQRAARAGREQRQAARRGNRPHRPQPVRRGLAARCLRLYNRHPPASAAARAPSTCKAGGGKLPRTWRSSAGGQPQAQARD